MALCDPMPNSTLRDRDEPVRPLAWALVVVVFLSDILYAGLIFGWAPLLLLLHEEDQYGELCQGATSATRCSAQDSRLNMVYAIASVATNISSLPVGCMLDYFGPKCSIAVAAVFEISGLFLLGAADSKTFDVFLIAYTFLAIGGCITMMASYPASFLVLSRQTAILAAISCLFDSSSVVLLAMYTIHSSFGFTRHQIFFFYGCASIWMYALLLGLWQVNERYLPDQSEAETTAAATLAQTKDITFTSPLLQPIARRHSMRDSIEKYGTLSEDELIEGKPLSDVIQLHKAATVGQTLLSDFPLTKQIQTFEFGFLLAYSSVHVLRANLYIGTNNKLLEDYGDAATNHFYTKLFSFTLPLGFLFVPFIDYFVEKKGLATSLHIATGLGVVYNTLAMLPILPLQAVVFFTFTGFRAFLYAAISAFAAKIFGLANLGRVVGITFTCGSIVSLLQIPAVAYANEVGNHALVYGLSTALCVALVPLTECYRYRAAQRMKRQAIVWKALGEDETMMLSPVKGLQYRRSPCLPSPVARQRALSKHDSLP
ncbi:hypothetical protein H310_04066 [Aphanomyces invadans]|uniref:Major facilitator superfamily (MFS) profile domain-containing protein n=1 Tax=Aphanomyces invadans TaxID=157072 RepID=A0A024UGL1_9STRA|nr:hypothetical protein H310_04066 [Aphanomyces invadans]ETW05002.1 hypothetical protein H310_04066 [Aphanomyces invadans]|eukprot:XP_008866440.1 hypothetical protein H310_04066 [Aphanomyces invadans]